MSGSLYKECDELRTVSPRVCLLAASVLEATSPSGFGECHQGKISGDSNRFHIRWPLAADAHRGRPASACWTELSQFPSGSG